MNYYAYLFRIVSIFGNEYQPEENQPTEILERNRVFG